MKTRNFKKLLSAVLVLMMVVSTMVIMPLTASAEGELGTEGNPYLIADAQGWQDFANAAAAVSGTLYGKLTKDIDFTGFSYARPGALKSGIYLDGQGNTMKNLTMTAGEGGNANTISLLHASATSATVIKNVNIVDFNFTNTKGGHGGVFFSYTLGPVTFENCSVTGGTLVHNHKDGAAGGYVGCEAGGPLTFTNCVSATAIESTNVLAAGGFVGKTSGSNATFTNCTNSGQISTGKTDAYVGGLIGFVAGTSKMIELKNCKNEGAVSATVGGNAGGLIGQSNANAGSSISLVGCFNNGAISSVVDNAGGLIGRANPNANVSVNGCVNKGTVTGAHSAGGIMGIVMEHTGNGNTITIQNSANLGAIATSNTGAAGPQGGVGGFIGTAYYEGSSVVPCTVSITNAYNTGALTGSKGTSSYLGGMIGVWKNPNCTVTLTGCVDKSTKTEGMTTTNAWIGQGATTPTYTNCLDENGDTDSAIAAINAMLYTPVISTESKNLEVRLKLTDDFGFMPAASMWLGADETGFVFSTEEITPENVATLDKTAGAKDGVKTYATYTGLSAAKLDTAIYFVAYVTVDGVTYYSGAREINCATLAEELQDGYYGDTLVTENTTEKNLYVAMVAYHKAYQAYLNSVTLPEA